MQAIESGDAIRLISTPEILDGSAMVLQQVRMKLLTGMSGDMRRDQAAFFVRRTNCQVLRSWLLGICTNAMF
jgi:hypothetical protein